MSEVCSNKFCRRTGAACGFTAKILTETGVEWKASAKCVHALPDRGSAKRSVPKEISSFGELPVPWAIKILPEIDKFQKTPTCVSVLQTQFMVLFFFNYVSLKKKTKQSHDSFKDDIHDTISKEKTVYRFQHVFVDFRKEMWRNGENVPWLMGDTFELK